MVFRNPFFRWRFAQSSASTSNRPTYFSLIDLGSDTIKVAVVAVWNGRIEVLGHSLAVTHGRDIAGGRAEAAALSAIVNGALQEAEDASETIAGEKIVPDQALFILPERTVMGDLVTVTQTRPDPKLPVTRQELDRLWLEVMRTTKQKLFTLPEVGPDWLPHTVTPATLLLDQHRVNDPVGLQGTTLSWSVYGVICQPAIVRALEQLATRLEVDIYNMVAASQALTTVVPARDALVFDIGWRGTHCYLIRYDALTAVGRSFMGGHFFTRSLAKTFNESVKAAEALKLAYASQDILSASDDALVRQALKTPIQRWADLMGEIVAKVQDDAPLPSRIYFTGGSAALPGLKERLLGHLNDQQLHFERTPEFHRLGETPLSGFNYAPTGYRGTLFALVLSLAKTV